MNGTTQQSQSKGCFIVIEGTDGTGKSTQYDLLRNRLKQEGHDLHEIHFPQYSEESSYFVRKYLAGDYGSADVVGPYTGSIFYALDKYDASFGIKKALEQGKVVLCDRFVGSNMAHQGTKFSNSAERRGYFIWLDNLEFETLKIPRPDKSFVLTNPLETILERINSRTDSSTHMSGKDIHEADTDHLKKSLEVYEDMCSIFPKDFVRIDGVRSNLALTPKQVHSQIWASVESMLPMPTGGTMPAATQPTQSQKLVAEANPYVLKSESGYEITAEGIEFLNKSVTNSTGNVYAFNDTLSPETIAAAMARLSRRGDDMRITLLDEFAAATEKDIQLLQRVITAYGDDSVQQLVGQHLVVENASNILTKKLEWGRMASYLEQSTRYIYFDEKTSEGKYRYYTPDHFDASTKSSYESIMDNIFQNYSKLVHDLTDYVRKTSDTPKQERDIAWNGATRAQACDAIRPVLPVATTSTVGIYASGQALESLIMHLLSDELPEARVVGQQILDEARKVIPTFLERADKPDRGGAIVAYRANTNSDMKNASTLLSQNHSSETEPVTLSSIWPRNELDIVPDMLYEHSSLPLAEIQNQVELWPISQKQDTFKSYMGERLNRRHKPGRAIEKVHYSWDLVCDYGIFRDLQRHRMVDDLEWQQLTPRYGYEIPKLVEDADLTELFEECFDLSLKLYSQLQQAGYHLESQYATLLGHRMRWKVTYNAREAFHLHELRTSPQGHPGYRKLVLQMHNKLAEVHPLMAESMKFVNQGEDPELTRLAAERATQFKLTQI
jgi:thymidylate kinase/thymidylate synthase ThyX